MRKALAKDERYKPYVVTMNGNIGSHFHAPNVGVIFEFACVVEARSYTEAAQHAYNCLEETHPKLDLPPLMYLRVKTYRLADHHAFELKLKPSEAS